MKSTKDDIKYDAELYAEQFRLVAEDSGWFQQKVNDFTAGYNACQQLLQQTDCSTHVCPSCKGTGEVQQTDTDFDDCRRCNGSGQIA